LNEQLLGLYAGSFDRYEVVMPPRHGKSLLCSVYFPAWWLLHRPQDRVLLVAYESDFAATWGRRVRDLLTEHGEAFGVSVRDDAAANRWDLEQGGGMTTAGIGGPITGKGADLVIIDDPVKNYEEAISQAVSRRNWDWYQSTLRTRLEPGGKIVLVATRWSEIDLTGRLLTDTEGEQWRELRLPAVAEEGDPLGRPEGAPLWPDRFDTDELAKVRKALSASHFSALYQGRPSPIDGDVFKREWFRYFVRTGDGYRLLITPDAQTVPVEDVSRFMTIDLAISTRRTADPTVMAVWGVDEAKNLLLLDLARKRIPGPAQLKLLQRLNAEWHPDRIVCEDVAYQRSFIEHAQQLGLPVVGVRPQGSKDARAIPAATRMEAGQVFFPAEARWLEELEHELLSFPNGRHDDQVDVFGYAAAEVNRRTRRCQSLAGWTIDPDLLKPGLGGSYSYDLPRGSPNIGP
jgi:predicted phage terminase large subunit-like protein